MKKGFTMIELIFVIVILGILAAVAIPKLAATRDDAKLAAVKSDIGTFENAIPAWYQGQKDVRIAKAVNIDTNQWEKNASSESYTLKLDGQACVTIAVWDMNGTDANSGSQVAVGGTDFNATTGAWIGDTANIPNGVPYFRVRKIAAGAASGICKTLWDDMGVNEVNITMAGQKVKW